MDFFRAFGGVFGLLIVVALGFLLSRLGWFDEAARKRLPKLVTNVALPPFLACTIIANFPRNDLAHMIRGALLPLLVMVVLFSLAWITGKLIRINKRRFGLFCACVSNPNTIFIGIPVNMALFGPKAIPYVLLYYFASTSFFWTVGNYFIGRDQGASGGAKTFRWTQIISPPACGFIFGLLVIIFDVTPPEPIFRAATIIGELTTPLALIFIGVTLQTAGISRLRPGRDAIIAIFGRMVVSPALTWALAPLFAAPPLMGKVFVIQSSLPVLMQVAILSAYYGTDPDFGSMMVVLTTILCVFTVPVYYCLL